MTKMITSSIKGNFGGGGVSFLTSMISTSESPWDAFSLDDVLEAVSDKLSGIGTFAYISINNIKRVVLLLRDSLIPILGFFADLRRGAFDFRLFLGGATSVSAFFEVVLLMDGLIVIVSSISDLFNGLLLANPGALAINVEKNVLREGVKKKH